MKKSFGTALKLYSYKNLTASALMTACTLALVWITPQPQPLIAAWQKQNTPQATPAKAIKKLPQR
jgi:hypothetical protein